MTMSDNRDQVGEANTPPCPGCGENDWEQVGPDTWKCKKCGQELTREQMDRMMGNKPAPYSAPSGAGAGLAPDTDMDNA